MRLTTAAKSGDRRKTLVALRDSIAKTIDNNASGRDVAALSKRLMEVMEELDKMPDLQEANVPKLVRFQKEQKRASGQ